MYRQTTASMGLCSFLLGSLAFQQSDRKDRGDFANEILPAYLKSLHSISIAPLKALPTRDSLCTAFINIGMCFCTTVKDGSLLVSSRYQPKLAQP